MWPEDPNAPRPAPVVIPTQDELTARRTACVCLHLPFYLGERAMCALHHEPEFSRLIGLRRRVLANDARYAGDTAPDVEPRHD